MKKKLVINRCPSHGDYWCVSIDGKDSGTRLTSPKCCGRWREVKSFSLSAGDWRKVAELATQAAEEAEKEGEA